jgi:hypothetical protein
MGSFSKSGLTRGDAVSDARVQAVHVIGGYCEAYMRVVSGVVCVLYVFGVCVLHVIWIVLDTASYNCIR